MMQMMSTTAVRKATMNDLDTVKRIADANRNTIGFVRRPALIEAIAKQWVLVAEVSGELVGFANFRHRRDLQTTLYEICVARSFRGQGIGRALIQALQEESKAFGKETIVLKAPVDIPANDFYQHMGFACFGVQPGKKRALRVWRRRG